MRNKENKNKAKKRLCSTKLKKLKNKIIMPRARNTLAWNNKLKEIKAFFKKKSRTRNKKLKKESCKDKAKKEQGHFLLIHNLKFHSNKQTSFQKTSRFFMKNKHLKNKSHKKKLYCLKKKMNTIKMKSTRILII